MNIKLPEYVEELINLLNKNNYEAYVVGGAIRSYLLHEEIHDYDLTTNALPDEMKEVFKDYPTIETGIKHGTLTVLINHHPIEITTYRKDDEYQDHRHPNTVTFTSALQEDCARRDFTINALCYNHQDGLKDFYNGLEDLNNHIIRCIGDAHKRFDEDALRILRALRFAARLNFMIEENTKQAIFNQYQLLEYISEERIHEELLGFLNAKSSPKYIEEFKEVFDLIIPELKDVNCNIDKLYSVDNAYIKLSILLTNINSPNTILNRLKCSNKEIKDITLPIKFKDFSLNTKRDLKQLMRNYSSDILNYLAYRHALDTNFNYEEIVKNYHEIIDNNECYSIKQLAINGNDLINLGYKGKQISTTLNNILDEIINDNLNNNKEEIITYINKRG